MNNKDKYYRRYTNYDLEMDHGSIDRYISGYTRHVISGYEKSLRSAIHEMKDDIHGHIYKKILKMLRDVRQDARAKGLKNSVEVKAVEKMLKHILNEVL